ncbi:hypothetical protein LXL04_012600 [Taraxacum kok-saghyz]
MKKSFFIFMLTCTLLSLPIIQSHPIRDTDRNVLLADTNYYIVPANRGEGGGVTLAPGIEQRCPFGVVQEDNESKKGLPLNFKPGNTSNNRIVHESADVNVLFSGKFASPCIEQSVWRVEDSMDGYRYVSSHAIIGSPGKETLRNWFKIEKYENDYKLVYCPTICTECRPAYCADIGPMITKNGRRSLVLNNVPLKVRFKKA